MLQRNHSRTSLALYLIFNAEPSSPLVFLEFSKILIKRKNEKTFKNILYILSILKQMRFAFRTMSEEEDKTINVLKYLVS